MGTKEEPKRMAYVPSSEGYVRAPHLDEFVNKKEKTTPKKSTKRIIDVSIYSKAQLAKRRRE